MYLAYSGKLTKIREGMSHFQVAQGQPSKKVSVQPCTSTRLIVYTFLKNSRTHRVLNFQQYSQRSTHHSQWPNTSILQGSQFQQATGDISACGEVCHRL